MDDRRITKLHGVLIEDARVDDILKDLKGVEDSKQNKLIAGEGIKIEDNTIAVDLDNYDEVKF